MERTLVRITDTVPVAAGFASDLEEAYFSAVTQLYPEIVIEVAVRFAVGNRDRAPEVDLWPGGDAPELDPAPILAVIARAIGGLKAGLAARSLAIAEADTGRLEPAADPA